jgi:hypothetical protein
MSATLPMQTMTWYYALVNDVIYGNGASIVRCGVDNQFDHAAYMDERVGKLSGGLSWHRTLEEAQAAMDALKGQSNG